MNADKIQQLKNAVIMVEFIAQFSRELSKDQTAMPDGSGTVAGSFALAVARLEIPYLQLLDTIPSEVLKAIAEKAAMQAGVFTPDLNRPSIPATDAVKDAPRAVQDAPQADKAPNVAEDLHPAPHSPRRACDAPGLMR